MLPAFEERVDAYGEPFACASALGMLRVSRAVKPMPLVLLTGDASGDDCFLGYPEHRNFYIAQRLAQRWPRWICRCVRAARPPRALCAVPSACWTMPPVAWAPFRTFTMACLSIASIVAGRSPDRRYCVAARDPPLASIRSRL